MSEGDDLARMRAEMDQAQEGSRELAKTLWGFYAQLLEEGFSEAQSLTLTVRWMHEVFQQSEPE